MADIPSPLKALIGGEYKMFEERALNTVMHKYNIQPPTEQEIKLLDMADIAAGIAEARVLFRELPLWLPDLEKRFDHPEFVRLAINHTLEIAEELDPILRRDFHSLERAFLVEFAKLRIARKVVYG